MRHYEAYGEFVALREITISTFVRSGESKLHEVVKLRRNEMNLQESSSTFRNDHVFTERWVHDFLLLRDTLFPASPWLFPSKTGEFCDASRVPYRISSLFCQAGIQNVPCAPESLSPDQWLKLTTEVRFYFQRQRYQVALAVAFLSCDALRPGELASLKKSNIDIDQFWICLPRPKKGRPEYMPLPAFLIEPLSRYISHLKLDDRLFINLQGTPWTRKDIYRVVKAHAAELGINDVVPRRVRATVGRLLRKNGATLDQTREFLRHVELRTTELHYAPDNIEERQQIFQEYHPLSSKNISRKVS
jgi:hypothetical protein